MRLALILALAVVPLAGLFTHKALAQRAPFQVPVLSPGTYVRTMSVDELKYPERFSAAIPVAGRPTPPSSDWKMPVFAVHSRQDEVVPIGPAEQRIAELKKAGVKAEIHVLTGITHYETNRFVDGLRKAVPWLREIWK